MENIEQKLGFDRLRAMVEESTTNALAAEMCRKMQFMSDFEELSAELQLLEEMRQIVLMESGFPRQDFTDLTPALSRLRIQGTALTVEEMGFMRTSLMTIADCIRFLLPADADTKPRYPRLAALAQTVQLDAAIGKEIARIVDEHGEICDTASPELAEIRRTIARKNAEVDARVSHALQQAKREGWAPEGAEVTLREGRPVIPLLTTHRRKMRGLIQDESASRQTAYVEPAEVVELGNDLRELAFDERHEIQRILLSFSDKLRSQLPQLAEAYLFLARVDFLRAKALVAVRLNACVPLLQPQPVVDWLDARHPLLFLQKGDGVVPFNLQLQTDRILIISGPNAGGKSVCLKAVGLIQYMLQCGMAVPLRPTSQCGLFGNVCIDIGDQQSIDNDLSTYTSHLQNMKLLLAEADDRTLFLLDELGGGTEPRSGCAIAEAVLETLHGKGSFGVVTTHFADLKLLADRMKGVVNGAMLYDTDQMRPLYRLSIGHPGSSFAFEIAESIGFPKEVLDRAGEKVGREQLNFEHQLQQLELEKQELQRQREELRVADDFLAEVTEKYQRLADGLQARRHEIVAEARREAQQILADANRTVERTISDIKSASAEREATRQARHRLEEATQQMADEIEKADDEHRKRLAARQPRAEATPEAAPLPVAVGTIVRIDSGDTYGQVVEIKGKKAVVESQSVRMTIPLSRLTGTAKQKLPVEKQPSESRFNSLFDSLNEKRAHFNPTLDLRGHRAEEAIDLLHQHLDTALLLGEKEVRILHGKGYGILMSLVRQQLQASRSVRSFHPERLELGGEGITVVELR